jgi:uncharacterized protein YbbK (DUF523 family)
VIIISACLCGVRCRYDGLSNMHPTFIKLLQTGQAIPVCPEQLGGLGTPRDAAEIAGGSGQQVLQGQARVLNKSGQDVSNCFIRGAQETLHLAQAVDASLLILKSRSPSCGVGEIYDGSFSSRLRSGDGVTAALLREYGYAVINDEAYLRAAESLSCPPPE